MAVNFVRARHEGVEGEALIAETAFPFMPGWVPVEDDVAVPTLADGPVKNVLSVVGDDKEKAAAALEAEQSSPSPRSTLVDALNRIIDEES